MQNARKMKKKISKKTSKTRNQKWGNQFTSIIQETNGGGNTIGRTTQYSRSETIYEDYIKDKIR